MTTSQLLIWSVPPLALSVLLLLRRSRRTAQVTRRLAALTRAEEPQAPPTTVRTGVGRGGQLTAPGSSAPSHVRSHRVPGASVVHPDLGRSADRARRRATAARWRTSRGGQQVPDDTLPITTELVAACLAAGASPARAAAAAGAAHDGPLAGALATAARELRMGGAPAVAWGRLSAVPGAQPLARRLELADTTGIPAVEAVTAAAAEQRAARQRAAQTAVRRAGVYITAPLGLCFLPAFLLLGVAPVVIGLATSLL